MIEQFISDKIIYTYLEYDIIQFTHVEYLPSYITSWLFYIDIIDCLKECFDLEFDFEQL